jgi:hypothetical protein
LGRIGGRYGPRQAADNVQGIMGTIVVLESKQADPMRTNAVEKWCLIVPHSQLDSFH